MYERRRTSYMPLAYPPLDDDYLYEEDEENERPRRWWERRSTSAEDYEYEPDDEE